MPYRILRKDSSVQAAVRRIACEQIDRAIRSIEHHGRAEAVHDVRRRCKKLRGLVRLVRPVFPASREENAAFRDIARSISGMRDIKVMQDTRDDLAGRYAGEADIRMLGIVGRGFSLDHCDEASARDLEAALAQCRDQLCDARERASGWTLSESGWNALGGGLKKTYSRARKAATRAHAERSTESLHELRKLIKYHWCHTRLLRGLWREAMTARAGLAKDVCEMLGAHHDLAVFEARIRAEPETLGSRSVADVMVTLARRRREELETGFDPLVARLLAQDAEGLAAHWETLWHVWHGEKA